MEKQTTQEAVVPVHLTYDDRNIYLEGVFPIHIGNVRVVGVRECNGEQRDAVWLNESERETMRKMIRYVLSEFAWITEEGKKNLERVLARLEMRVDTGRPSG